MRFSRKERRRRLGFESLETKRVFAGAVSAEILGDGTLQLVGDLSPNAVEVSGNGNAGEVRITPLADLATGQQTTVNGSSSPIVLTGVTGGLTAGLNAGNDELYVKDYAFTGNGRIWGQAGADTIRLGALVTYGRSGTGDVSFGGSLRIDEYQDTSAADGDYIFLGRVVVDEYIDILGYHGNDTVKFYNVYALGQRMPPGSDPLRLSGNDGNDVFDIAYTTVHGDVWMSTDGLYGGNDVVSVITSVFYGGTYIDVWHGVNTVALNANQFLKTLEIYSEIGNDTIILTNSYCVKKVTMASFYVNSNGNDSFRVEGNIISERIYLSSGSGVDSVIVRNNQIATAGIFTGAGSDALTVRYNVFYGHADFVGGTEFDVLYLSGNLFHSSYAYYEFESIQP
jgi:hypothetical protein